MYSASMWGPCLARVRTCPPCTRLSANTRPWARTGPGRAPSACVGGAGSHLGRRRRARCSQRVGACTRYRSPHERMWVGCVQIEIGRGDTAVNCRLGTHTVVVKLWCQNQHFPYVFTVYGAVGIHARPGAPARDPRARADRRATPAAGFVHGRGRPCAPCLEIWSG